MLVLIVKRDGRVEEQVEWKLGDQKSIHAFGTGDTTMTVIGNGLELEWIRTNITGIRMSKYASQVRWTGEDAVFIANALPRPEQL